MYIRGKLPKDWRERGICYNYNGMAFSLAWKKNGTWKTFYRKFNLQTMRRHVLIGKYISNLHFDEELNKENENSIMIYSVPIDIKYETIDQNFKKQNFDFLIFKEIFNINNEDIKFYLPNLKFQKDCSVILNGQINKNNSLQIKIYKKENKLGITLPQFSFSIKDIIKKKN